MDTMRSVSLAFKYSDKHLLVFEEQLGSKFAVREEMGRKTKVKVLCETHSGERLNFNQTVQLTYSAHDVPCTLPP